MSRVLADAYEAAFFDLDGVVYLGPEPVEGAAEGIEALRQRGLSIGFVTNNASRTPQAVADQLNGLGIAADPDDVVTAAQAGAKMLADKLSPGARVLIVGSEALADEISAVGLTPVREIEPTPDAVIQGYDPEMTMRTLSEAGIAIQRGALWLATNTDPTRPTEQGLVPGNGAAVAMVRTAVDVDPLVAGKPAAPLIEETIRRLGSSRAIFVGDRTDTDIAGGAAAGLDTMLVFTGAHGKADLLVATGPERPTHIGADLRALEEPAAEVQSTDERVRCGDATAWADDGVARVQVAGETAAEQLDALRALAVLVWGVVDKQGEIDHAEALKTLSQLS